MYLDAKGETGDRSVTGHLAAGVPGSVAGLWEAHQKLGSKAVGELVEPAIRLAEAGFEVDAYAAGRHQGRGRATGPLPRLGFLVCARRRAAGGGYRLKNPDLARTLRRIAEHGRDGFYKGETADLLVAEMKRGKGIITAKISKAMRRSGARRSRSNTAGTTSSLCHRPRPAASRSP